jgi:3-oxoadipate enol-lactonase
MSQRPPNGPLRFVTVGAASSSKPPLLLIAGLGQGTWVWDDVLAALERDSPVIVFEARGTGTRVHLSARRSIGEMADDVRGELDRPAHVLGFSMGGYVALTLALREPELMRSLLLVGTGSGGPGRVPRPRYVAEAVDAALGLPSDEFTELTMPFAVSRGWADANPERFRKIVAAQLEQPTPYESLEAHGAACYRFYAEGCTVEEIRVQALVVHGDQDVIVPVENGRALARRLPRVEYVELPGCGHNVMVEDPETFVRLVREFLASVPVRA